MKNYILAAVVFLCLGLPAYADIVPLDFNGVSSQMVNNMWEPGSAIGAGGGARTDNDGAASQFTVSQETQLTGLLVGATVVLPGTSDVNFDIYTGTKTYPNPPLPVPDFTSLAFSSSPVTYTQTQQQFDQRINPTHSNQVSFDYTLEPNTTYWFAETTTAGNDAAEVEFTSIQYQGNIMNNTAVAPEPPSVWLMFLGLAGAFFDRSRKFFGMA